MKPTIQIKRTYEPPAPADGRRLLVERLWPRGMTKEAVAADAWLKDVAPSTELRQWFAHRVERWPEFRRRYEAELEANPAAWEPIVEAGRDGPVTLLYSARDADHNAAVVLRDYLAARAVRRAPHTRSQKSDRIPRTPSGSRVARRHGKEERRGRKTHLEDRRRGRSSGLRAARHR